MFAGSSLAEERVEGIISSSNGLVRGHLQRGVLISLIYRGSVRNVVTSQMIVVSSDPVADAP